MADRTTVAIIGAGPAGLTAGYVLAKAGIAVTILESDPEYVGGIARTARYHGYHFDIGGHRFFSKSREIEDLWSELLPEDMLTRPRSSRIFYKGKFFSYPLKAMEALRKLGLFEAARCGLSYAWARVMPVKNPKSFEDWVSNQFGRRLFNMFFKTYTEKVWGMSCKEISADWAAQRIKGLSLAAAVLNALLPRRTTLVDRSRTIKSLIDSFRYPRRGPGMMWEACASRITNMGGRILMGRTVTGCRFNACTRRWTLDARDLEGAGHTVDADHVISSAPMRDLVRGITPPVSPEARSAASALRYRDFLTVVLMLRDRGAVTDNWIYIHDPGVRVGRVQNFKSWSPEMVPDPAMTCYGLEYFCFEGDDLWNAPDHDLIALGRRELAAIGLAAPGDVVDGAVVRQPKAYPVYDEHYAEHVDTIRRELDRAYPNLHLVGRNGMHKYNNQDHAMMTAILAARNILAGQRVHDVWAVNEDAEYHEAGEAGQEASTGLRLVPTRRTE
jgi:protoporphyrinogen oxidase